MSVDIRPYKLPDEAFWQTDDRAGDAMGRQLLGKHRGVLVDAPGRVDLALRHTVPAGIFHLGAIRDMRFVTLARHAALTAIDLDTNRLYLQPGSALVLDDDLEEPEPVDPARLPEGDMCTTQSVDLRRLFGLPWAPARLLVTVLLRGDASNRVAVELVGAEPAAGSASVIERERPPEQDGPTPIEVPPAAADGAAPAVPDAPGVVLSLPRVVRPRLARSWPLGIALRLPAGTTARQVHLVVLGADGDFVDRLTVAPQHFDDDGGQACCRVEVDLSQHLRLPQPQTYFVRAFVGGWMSDAVASALVVDDER